MKKCYLCAAVVFMIMAISAMPAFSQTKDIPAKEGQSPTQASQTATAQAVPQAAPAQEAVKTGELSIYGEIQAVNVQAGSMTVQYYDYDNDEEKTLEVALDKDSKLENVKAISEIKKGDWADVTYTAAGGKNTARIVSVEKEEPTAEEPVSTGTAEE